ncbi:hypothetical protein BD309DRAFT_954972 [Dichomitus squalens]|nr:hypothetical protein BD309DRAFT_954972 [Dichomitus squalens]
MQGSRHAHRLGRSTRCGDGIDIWHVMESCSTPVMLAPGPGCSCRSRFAAVMCGS